MFGFIYFSDFQISLKSSQTIIAGLLDVRICQYYSLGFGRRTALHPVGMRLYSS